MASLNLDDGEKKPKDFLDLRNVNIDSQGELNKWLEKIPDLKIRLEKVRDEELTAALLEEPNKTEEEEKEKWQVERFQDPVPNTMREVNLRELGRVEINWRMLTMARPKTKIDEDLFSRLVQLEKLQYRTMQWEQDKELIAKKDGMRFGTSRVRMVDCDRRRPQRSGLTKSAVTETRLQTCKECGEEFCSGVCRRFAYEDYKRTFNPIAVDIFHIHKAYGHPGKKSFDSPPPAQTSPALDEASEKPSSEVPQEATTSIATSDKPTGTGTKSKTSKKKLKSKDRKKGKPKK